MIISKYTEEEHFMTLHKGYSDDNECELKHDSEAEEEFNLSMMYNHGQYVDKNHKKASDLYCLALHKGDALVKAKAKKQLEYIGTSWMSMMDFIETHNCNPTCCFKLSSGT